MKRVYLLVAVASLILCGQARAATFAENFSTDPLANGWSVFGNTNLFAWDPTNHDLMVTWDSSQPNSYFSHPLGTILTTNDDFTLSFDLQLNTAQGAGFSFELAIGLFNYAQATNASFQRSTSENSPDLVEFNFYPDTGFGATVWPIFADTNSTFNWNGSNDYAIYQPISGGWYHIVMTYTASNLTMVTTMTNFEQTSGITVIDPINLTNTSYSTGLLFTDYRVDSLSISSYQDDGYGDSIYAQGVVANIALTLPPPPIQNITGGMGDGKWRAQFLSQDYWLYNLQRTVDFQSWTNLTPSIVGNGTNLLLLDTNPPPNQAFYRVSASRP